MSMYDETKAKMAAQEKWENQYGAGQVGYPSADCQQAGYNSASQCMATEIQDMRLARTLRRLEYHPPTDLQIPRYQAIRDAAKAFATVVVRNCPIEDIDTEHALDMIEAAVMIANKAIANA